jgi:hypothetical protein
MLKAKEVIPNKFWILENNEGKRTGTMSLSSDPQTPDAVKVNINNIEKVYVDVNQACWDLVINIASPTVEEQNTNQADNTVLGYPVKCDAFNPILDIKRKLPVFTKTEKSKTLHAAGYYIVLFDTGWVQSFCPKVSTLDSNEYKGPFKDKLEMREQLRIAQNASDVN